MLIRGGAFFPHRDLIIFISFVVILVTLVFQGLTLPFVIRWVKIRDTEPAEKEDQQQVDIQLRLIKAASEKLHEKYAEEINGNELLRGYKTELEHRMAYVSEHLRCTTCGVSGRQEIEQYNKVLKSIYQYQRKELFRFKREGIFNDELIRKEEKQIDLNEAKVLER
ncbi:hypothetical protein GCM10023149_16180 [Mucilaginibacter gynuensis]|uniref:Na+/H+ antiporter n=2 Tax=Mucilaginibacter gynuensis TaxID=1302236 RepID=A0ABP8G6T4_9SPHI